MWVDHLVGLPSSTQPPPVHTRETLLSSHATVQPHYSPEDSCQQIGSACPDALSVPCSTFVASSKLTEVFCYLMHGGGW